MKKLFYLISIQLFVLSVGALASGARPDTRRMSCGDVQALVQQNGAIVLSTGNGQFDRYVANGSFCGRGASAQPAAVPTIDRGNCVAGFICSNDDTGSGYQGGSASWQQ
jgi:hypothetical protein